LYQADKTKLQEAKDLLAAYYGLESKKDDFWCDFKHMWFLPKALSHGRALGLL
jgi:hypothetical protein